MLAKFLDTHWQLNRTVGPDDEPVSLSEAKSHIEESSSDKDDLITDLISAAREMVETDTDLALMPQTWQANGDRFPSDWIELRRPPVTAVSSVQYYDEDGNQQTWASSNYDVDLAGFPGRVSRAYAKSWPTIQRRTNAITVTFTAGYADADSVPVLAKQAILLLVGHWYEHREAIGRVTQEIDLTYTSLRRRLQWDL